MQKANPLQAWGSGYREKISRQDGDALDFDIAF